MKFPKVCPVCKKESCLFMYDDIDFMYDRDRSYIYAIFECSECRSFFLAKWKLCSLKRLVEEDLESSQR